MKMRWLFLLAGCAALCLMVFSCGTWQPKVFHPGLGNAGGGLGHLEDFEIGVSSYLEVPSFLRSETRLARSLTLSLGGGLTGLDLSGLMGGLNWVAIDGEDFYLTLSPHVVFHGNEQYTFNAFTASLGITPGIRLDKLVCLYLSVMPAYYHAGAYATVQDGEATTPGGKGWTAWFRLGADLDLGGLRFFVEVGRAAHEMIGTTWLLPVASLGVMLGF